MQRYEYKVVPAPKKGEKAKNAKTPPERFAVALMTVMNALGAEGWEYLRADTLPCDERVGLTGSKSVFQNMLVFRRKVPAPDTLVKRPPPVVAAAAGADGAAGAAGADGGKPAAKPVANDAKTGAQDGETRVVLQKTPD